jgi:hypothetical protein
VGASGAEDELIMGQVSLMFIYPIGTDYPQAWLAGAANLF